MTRAALIGEQTGERSRSPLRPPLDETDAATEDVEMEEAPSAVRADPELFAEAMRDTRKEDQAPEPKRTKLDTDSVMANADDFEQVFSEDDCNAVDEEQGQW